MAQLLSESRPAVHTTAHSPIHSSIRSCVLSPPCVSILISFLFGGGGAVSAPSPVALKDKFRTD